MPIVLHGKRQPNSGNLGGEEITQEARAHILREEKLDCAGLHYIISDEQYWPSIQLGLEEKVVRKNLLLRPEKPLELTWFKGPIWVSKYEVIFEFETKKGETCQLKRHTRAYERDAVQWELDSAASARIIHDKKIQKKEERRLYTEEETQRIEQLCNSQIDLQKAKLREYGVPYISIENLKRIWAEGHPRIDRSLTQKPKVCETLEGIETGSIRFSSEEEYHSETVETVDTVAPTKPQTLLTCRKATKKQPKNDPICNGSESLISEDSTLSRNKEEPRSEQNIPTPDFAK
ncbi:MAG: hypothetical protein IT289_04155 [Oligoflexia bacterium]|nr:hypothetical protein [Oligoflexia bacterium]